VSMTDSGTTGGRATWGSPAPVLAAMLNPGLVALVLAGSCSGYQHEADSGLPWALSFVVAPLVLHRGARDALPQKVSSHLPVWVARHPAIRAGFPQRAAALAEPLRQGLRFGGRYGGLTPGEDRVVAAQPVSSGTEPHLHDLVSKATFVGRWMSKLDQPSTAFAVFGITV